MAPRWTCPVCFSCFMVLCPQSADSLLLGPRPLKVCFVTVYQASATLGSPQFCSFLYTLLCVDSGPHPPFLDTIQASFTTFPTPFLILEFLPSGKTSPTQPRSCLACLHCALLLSMFIHSPHVCWGACGCTGESNWKRQRVSEASSDFTGRPMWFSSLAKETEGVSIF